MKSNAPEKLYIGENDKAIFDIYSSRESDDEIEYTSTDAFIEKACAWLDENLIYYWEQLNVDDTAELLDDFKKGNECMKRVIEETLGNGNTRYRVETNKILGFIPCKWHTDTFYDGERDLTFDAVFGTIDEAYSHMGIIREGSPCEVVSRKIIY